MTSQLLSEGPKLKVFKCQSCGSLVYAASWPGGCPGCGKGAPKERGTRMRQVLRYIGVAAIAALLTLAGMTAHSARLEWRGMRTEILAMRVLITGDVSKSLAGEVERRRLAEVERKAALDAAKAKATGTPAPEAPKP